MGQGKCTTTGMQEHAIVIDGTFFPFFCCFASFPFELPLLLGACADPREGKPSSSAPSASWGGAEPLLEPCVAPCGRLELHASHDRVSGPLIKLHLPKKGMSSQQQSHP